MARKSKISIEVSAQNKTRQTFRQVNNDLNRLTKTAAKVGSVFGAISGAAIVGLGTQIGRISAEFETLRKTLETVTGSSIAADRAFQQIRDFASETPFQIEQITEAFIKLKALGLDPSVDALTSYGNTAAAFGKSINQVVEAVADATTGEFERLKEFGIKAKTEGDNVTFIFRGVSTTIRKEAAAIERYIRDIGDVTFADAMANQADTLAVAFSNMTDAFRAAAAELASDTGFDSALKSAVQSLTDFIRETFTAQGRVDALRESLERVRGGSLRGRNAPAGSGREARIEQQLLTSLEATRDAVGIRTEIARLEQQIAEREASIASQGASARRRGGSRGTELTQLKSQLEAARAELEAVELDMADVGAAGQVAGEQAAAGFTKTSKAVKVLKDDMDLLLDLYEAEEEANAKRFAQAQAGNTAAFRDALQAREEALEREQQKQDELARAADEALRRQQQFADQVAGTMVSAFEEAIIGANSLSDIVKGLIQDIATMVIRMAVLQPLANSISGGLTPYVGAFATGGTIPRTGTALVGEAGPELVSLPGGATVTPNNRIGGDVNVQVINNANASVETQTDTAPDGSSLVRFIINTVANDMTSNGPTARALGGYGAAMQPVVR